LRPPSAARLTAPMSRRARRRKPRGTSAAPAMDPAVGWYGAPPPPVAALLFGSGTTALVYETLWVKQLGRLVGVEVHAVSIALSAFFAGLARAGGVLGTLATPFLLVPAFGIEGTGFFSAALGLAVAVAALLLDRRVRGCTAAMLVPAVASAPGALRDARIALALYAAAGGVALG